MLAISIRQISLPLAGSKASGGLFRYCTLGSWEGKERSFASKLVREVTVIGVGCAVRGELCYVSGGRHHTPAP